MQGCEENLADMRLVYLLIGRKQRYLFPVQNVQTRIQGFLVLVNFIMKVVSGGTARIAHISNYLTPFYLLLHFDGTIQKMSVKRLVMTGMLNSNDFAQGALIPDAHDFSVSRSNNWCTTRG